MLVYIEKLQCWRQEEIRSSPALAWPAVNGRPLSYREGGKAQYFLHSQKVFLTPSKSISYTLKKYFLHSQKVHSKLNSISPSTNNFILTTQLFEKGQGEVAIFITYTFVPLKLHLNTSGILTNKRNASYKKDGLKLTNPPTLEIDQDIFEFQCTI